MQWGAVLPQYDVSDAVCCHRRHRQDLTLISMPLQASIETIKVQLQVSLNKHARLYQMLLQNCMQTRQALPDVIAELHANTPGCARCYCSTACKDARRCQMSLQHCMQTRHALPHVTLQHCMHSNTPSAARCYCRTACIHARHCQML